MSHKMSNLVCGIFEAGGERGRPLGPVLDQNRTQSFKSLRNTASEESPTYLSFTDREKEHVSACQARNSSAVLRGAVCTRTTQQELWSTEVIRKL